MKDELKYLAYRDEPADAEELRAITSLTHGYWRDFPEKESQNGPSTYLEDGGPIYAGSLYVPPDLPEEKRREYLAYWLSWLTDVTRKLRGARWNVRLGDVPLGWEEFSGWEMPAVTVTALSY